MKSKLNIFLVFLIVVVAYAANKLYVNNDVFHKGVEKQQEEIIRHAHDSLVHSYEIRRRIDTQLDSIQKVLEGYKTRIVNMDNSLNKIDTMFVSLPATELSKRMEKEYKERNNE